MKALANIVAAANAGFAAYDFAIGQYVAGGFCVFFTVLLALDGLEWRR